nr:MAG TPA: hypothetical protein [Caudoviricetes sp.]
MFSKIFHFLFFLSLKCIYLYLSYIQGRVQDGQILC